MSYKNNQLEESKRWSYATEEELNEIYEFQYNDVFSKILIIDSTQFINVLEKQIIINLYLLKKQPILSSLSKISELYIQRYYRDREKVYQAYKIIKYQNMKDIEFLDKLNCFLHCPNCSLALHTCGNKFILCNDYIFCLYCKKVYNENQAKMYCDFCNIEYYTKLREITNEELENFFPVCFINNDKEIIKCKNCNEILLLNIEDNRVNIIEKNNINLFCKKCKNNFIYNSQEIKLFNEFTKDKIDILCIIHTLLKRKFANPKGIKKYCLCELPLNIKYKHIKDNGNLLEGLRQGKKIIICDKCFQIFEYKNYNNWICPECGLKFNEKINSKYNTAISNNKMKSIFLNNKIIEKERENSKINNNININNQRYSLRDNKKNINLNKISTNESLEQLNKNNNNIKTSIIQLNKENSNTNTNFNDSININININKSKRVITSKLLSQENRIKRNYNNTNSNLVESKYISKKDNNNKNQIKNNKEQNNKNNNVIKVDFGKYNNTNLNSAKSSLNILSKNENKNIQIKNINEKNKNNINIKSSNSNMKIEILKRNYSLDKNKEEKNTNNKNNNNNNIINSNRNIKIKYNNEKGDNKLSDKVIQRNKGSPNHKRVDIVETRLKKNLNSKNNIQNINIKFSQDFDNIISNNIKNNLNNSKSNKEIKEFKPLYKSINLINNNSNNQPNNSNNIYISDNSKEKEETSKSIKDTSKENKENVTKEKGIIKIDTSRNISSEGYQFNSDNYNIVQLLGEGTFGKIYLVEDPDDLKKYALKKISVSDLEELNDTKKEFELLMKLSQENPSLNVVKIYGIQIKKLDKFNLVMYVLMEAAQCDWENEIRNRNQYQAYYTEEELMKILLNLSTTLASLQKMGICHRDVKPQNILCFGKDNYKLSDFGEAKKKKKRKINGNYIYDFEGDTSKQTVRGTELYMSPILFKALHDCPEVDLEYNAYKSDVFSLGLCMLLSSTLGFQALYDIRELYDNNKIKKIIEKYLSVRYSKDYIKLISSMLQIKEKNRPDFIELQENIQKIYYHKDKKE